MISSVYSYYLAQYGHKTNSKYDTHTKAQLKNTYGRVLKSNSQTPTYKADMSEAAQKYAIDLKENARELSNIANELSGSDGHGMVFKKSAVSSNPQSVTAEYIGDSSSPDSSSFEPFSALLRTVSRVSFRKSLCSFMVTYSSGISS